MASPRRATAPHAGEVRAVNVTHQFGGGLTSKAWIIKVTAAHTLAQK